MNRNVTLTVLALAGALALAGCGKKPGLVDSPRPEGQPGAFPRAYPNPALDPKGDPKAGSTQPEAAPSGQVLPGVKFP